MGREVDMDYGTDKSTSNIKKAARALPWLGYWDVSNTRYNHDIIELMVGERRLPVYMRGMVEFTDGTEGGAMPWWLMVIIATNRRFTTRTRTI